MEKKITFLEQKLEQIEQETAPAIQRSLLAIEELKNSEVFDDEIDEAGVEGYKLGFEDCVNKVKQLYPDFDISSISIDEVIEEEAKKSNNNPKISFTKETSVQEKTIRTQVN